LTAWRCLLLCRFFDAGSLDAIHAFAAGLTPCCGLPGVVDLRAMGAIGVVELTRIADLDRLRARFVEERVLIRRSAASSTSRRHFPNDVRI
jgi:adenosylmethionine-8-amino-7-oxononanoate aminotransferase